MINKKCMWKTTALVLAAAVLTGCGSAGGQSMEAEGLEEHNQIPENEEKGEEKRGLEGETAQDGHIDFEYLKKENPDIFAWLYVPGTGIDYPILQSPVSDEYYITHTPDGAEGKGGALYTEMPNMMDMCDFNTIIHGKDSEDGDLFSDLHKFESPDFFAEHESFYIYLPDNVLTYEIFAAYYDEGSDILRRYDYTTYKGCEDYLKQVYSKREMGRNLREGWDDLTPYHFLVTLNGSIQEKEDRQYVVIGVLTGDAAGSIDRIILN